MEKLTLEHLAGYLPYGLKIRTSYDDFKTINNSKTMVAQDLGRLIKNINNFKFKPILRPLSDLTENEMNVLSNLHSDRGKKVEKLSDLTFYYGNVTDLEEIKNVFNYLYKKHFDIHGLIDKNLAIDINTL